MLFLNKKKGAISKIAPKMSLKRGRRYLNIINSAFLLPPHPESFENEIAPLKTHLDFFIFEKCLLFVQIEEFQFLGYEFSKALFRLQSFSNKGAIKRRYY